MGKENDADAVKIEPHWLKKKDMAAALGISLQAFDRWNLDPVARKGRSAYFLVRDVVDYAVARERKKHEQGPANLDAAELLMAKERAELALTSERAENARLKNAALRKELAPVSMVQWAVSQAGSQIAAVLGTLKGRVRRAQPDLSNSVLHEIEKVAVETQNVAASIRLDWNDFDESDLADPRVD